LTQYRAKGLGRAIVQKLEEIAVELGCSKFKLHGQTHAEGFYTSMGYRPAAEVFLEEGIEHKLFLKEKF
jgi:predicted GNAT family N-acyltransferase